MHLYYFFVHCTTVVYLKNIQWIPKCAINFASKCNEEED